MAKLEFCQDQSLHTLRVTQSGVSNDNSKKHDTAECRNVGENRGMKRAGHFNINYYWSTFEVGCNLSRSLILSSRSVEMASRRFPSSESFHASTISLFGLTNCKDYSTGL